MSQQYWVEGKVEVEIEADVNLMLMLEWCWDEVELKFILNWVQVDLNWINVDSRKRIGFHRIRVLIQNISRSNHITSGYTSEGIGWGNLLAGECVVRVLVVVGLWQYTLFYILSTQPQSQRQLNCSIKISNHRPAFKQEQLKSNNKLRPCVVNNMCG